MQPFAWVETPCKAPPPIYQGRDHVPSQAASSAGPDIGPVATPEHFDLSTPPAAARAYHRDGDAPRNDRAVVVAKKWLELIDQMNPREDKKAAMRIRMRESVDHLLRMRENVESLQARLAVSMSVHESVGHLLRIP